MFSWSVVLRPKLDTQTREAITKIRIGNNKKVVRDEIGPNKLTVEEEDREKTSSLLECNSPDDESRTSSIIDVTREETCVSTTCDEDQDNSSMSSEDNKEGLTNFLPAPTQAKFGKLIKTRGSKSSSSKVLQHCTALEQSRHKESYISGWRPSDCRRGEEFNIRHRNSHRAQSCREGQDGRICSEG